MKLRIIFFSIILLILNTGSFSYAKIETNIVVKIENDIRLISVDYLIQKLNVMLSSLRFLWKFIDKIEFLKKLTLRINLFDLKIYYCTKIEKNS